MAKLRSKNIPISDVNTRKRLAGVYEKGAFF